MGLVVVVLAGVAIGGWLLLKGSGGGPEPLTVRSTDGKPLPGVKIERTSEQGTDSLDEISHPVSPMLSVTSSDPEGTPAKLRFRIPAGVERAQLAVATQERSADGWSLLQGQVVGGDYVIQTDHLSLWQLRKLNCPSRLQDPIGFTVNAITKDPSKPMIIACAAEVDGKPAVRVYNNLSIALEFRPPPGTAIAEVKGRTLGERIAELADQLQTRDKLLPGGGVLTLTFDQPPGSIDFTAETSAATFEAALSELGTDAPVEAVQCLHDASQRFKDADLTKLGELRDAITSAFGSCKGLLPAGAKAALSILNTPEMVGKVADMVRHFRERATVVVTEAQSAQLPAVQTTPAEQGLSLSGLGPIHLGMSRQEVESATGLKFESAGFCIAPAGQPESYDRASYFLELRGRLVQAIVLGGGGVTDRGIQVGDSVSQLRAAYGSTLAQVPSIFEAAGPGFVYSTGDSNDPSRLVFGTAHGQIQGIALGYVGDADHRDEFCA